MDGTAEEAYYVVKKRNGSSKFRQAERLEQLKIDFTKQSSKHSVGTFLELCRGINTYFEALAEADILDLPDGVLQWDVVQEKAQVSLHTRLGFYQYLWQ